ncbi:MAG: pyridoxamine 5'-phosphate oxidase family protein [Gammaproteobacteria bacterium]|nr:pyridoxamine 5'-phosphate oxidase family protein [Gammaproteobacteria bacterium]
MKVFDSISNELTDWIYKQPLFFNATSPLGEQGHVNLSPRGLDSFRVLDPNHVAILDLTGSGNETAAHLLENGRITVMFCAFEGAPQILRLYGTGEVILPGNDDWAALRECFSEQIPGVRQIFKISVTRVQTSCGFGVPLMDFVAQRDTLTNWATKKGEAGIRDYQREKNSQSIDGLVSAFAEE